MMYLDANEEAILAPCVCHGRNGEHVPEGLPIFTVVEQPDGGLSFLLHRLPDFIHCLAIRLRTLQVHAPSKFPYPFS